MRRTLALLLLLVGMTTATALVIPPPSATQDHDGRDRVPLELTEPSLGHERVVTLPCPATSLHFVTQDADDDVRISALLWEAGAPPGTTSTFYNGDDAAERATAGAALDRGRLVEVPRELTLDWARTVLCPADGDA